MPEYDGQTWDPFTDTTWGGYYDEPGSGDDRMWAAFRPRYRPGHYRPDCRDEPDSGPEWNDEPPLGWEP